MKELRPTVNRVEWRVAYAFDPNRTALILFAAAKGGASDRKFYKTMIDTADARFDAHLERLKPAKRK